MGGNTSCVAIAHDDEDVPRLVLDAGTGLRSVSTLLGDAPFLSTILLGHLHWDHTYGLPFFRGGDRPDAITRLLLPEQGVDPLELLQRFMGPPAFPIQPDRLRGSWTFESIDEGVHSIEGFEVLAREIPHKGGRTFGYRISDGDSSLAYLSDHGPAGVLGPGPDGLGPYHEAALELCARADLVIHDAQYTRSELPGRIDFGHSAGEYAVELARRSGAGSVVLFHHDPDRTDDEVDALERLLDSPGGPDVVAGREGDTIRLPLTSEGGR
ncbi:MBL fold metallo-hydrolase [Ilumatobacter sp.]|uniref:MBL fold metallo-hydrolase n=1 Tax=Ilumatobacter sp. TaxID=1967498 RepID=UPI003AF4C28C